MKKEPHEFESKCSIYRIKFDVTSSFPYSICWRKCLIWWRIDSFSTLKDAIKKVNYYITEDNKKLESNGWLSSDDILIEEL